jgi:hypothetical protein
MKEIATFGVRATRLRAKLAQAFALPDSAYRPLDAATVIKRNARKRKMAEMDSDPTPDPTMGRIVEIARAMLAGRVSFIEGSREISEMVPGELRDDPDIIPFIAVDSETDTLPLGDQQELWQPKALEKLKPKIDRAEQWAKDAATSHCMHLIERFKDDLKA